MSEAIWAVVPYKDDASAKSRLSEFLTPSERSRLVFCMLQDVLQTLTSSNSIQSTLVVSKTSSREVASLCSRLNSSLYRDTTNSLAAAVLDASLHLQKHSAAREVLILPADIPLVSTTDIKLAVDARNVATVIPDREHIGTNGVVWQPGEFELVFDGSSYDAHLANATKSSRGCQSLSLDSFAIDVDTYYDLLEVSKLPGAPITSGFLQEINIKQRLRKAI